MSQLIINNYPLDEEQMKPIIENPKYSIIIAGAGSGKTMTLVGKIKYLLENKIYTCEEICCISFTNESARNLEKNILKNCHQQIPTYTFHKLALEILNKNEINYQIINDDLLSYIINEFFYSKCFGNQYLISHTYKYFQYLFQTEYNWQKILSSKKLQQTKKLIITFINLFKCNHNSIQDFIDYFKDYQNKNLLVIIYSILLIYKVEKESTKTIDFDDMITLATKTLQNSNKKLPFKIIIIDEFQDTSLIRFQLINEIIRQNNASLCVVGDDYQSIYHFSGCDLHLFLHFTNFFPTAKAYKLQKTYRNSQELIDIAGDFIQKNPQQIKKKLVSSKKHSKPIKLVYYNKTTSVLENIIKRISPSKEILILGRNHFDIKPYLANTKYTLNSSQILTLEKFPDHKIKYLTIHAAKGLESDTIIILNMADGTHGFPSLQKDQSILKHVKTGEFFPFEEERRLFYVALTRTKEEVYLLIPQKNPSRFVKEIKNKNGIEKIIL